MKEPTGIGIPEIRIRAEEAAPDGGPAFDPAGLKAETERLARLYVYEPNTEETAARMRDELGYALQRALGGVGSYSVSVDTAADLAAKPDACRGCREAGSYDEYRLRRAAMNLPDEAGSEREWRRMASFVPGQTFLNVTLTAPSPIETVECSLEIR